MVHGLVCHATSNGSVPNHCNAVVFPALQAPTLCHLHTLLLMRYVSLSYLRAGLEIILLLVFEGHVGKELEWNLSVSYVQTSKNHLAHFVSLVSNPSKHIRLNCSFL